MWQDYVFAAGAVVFSVALLPTVRSEEKPPLLTSVPTALVLYIFSLTFATLHLWFSTTMQFITATLWATLALQRYVKSKR